jgi:hypothetical protein
MPYLCDIRSGAANNVIEVGGKLFIEGVEFTPTNLAPIAFSQGPTAWGASGGIASAGSQLTGLQAVGQLCLNRTYVRGSMVVYPAAGGAGQYDTTKIACGQDIGGSSFIWSAAQARYYGQAGFNAPGYLSSFDSSFRTLSTGIGVGTTIYTAGNATGAGTLFLPLQNGRWIFLTAASVFSNSLNSLANQLGMAAGTLTEAGAVSLTLSAIRYPAMPYIGTDWVVFTGAPASTTSNDASQAIPAYALNRSTGALTTLNSAWLPSVALPAVVASPYDYQYSFPSNAIIETPGSQIYFYQPVMSATALNVFIGTVSNMASTPTISASTTTYTTTMPGGIDTTNDWITTSGDIPNLSRVRFTTSTSYPSPLATNIDYWTIRVTATTSRIATSYANAVAGTYIDLTTAPASGTLTTTAFATLNLDTSAVSFVTTASSVWRNTRAWTFSNSGINYLCVGVYEPGATNTVATSALNLYLWRLDSKTTSTFLQKLDTGSAGRVRAFMPIDSSQKRIVVVYDDKIVFYAWNSSTNWTFQSTQNINTQDVGIDSQGRVWATDLGSYVPGSPSGYNSQSLYVYEPAGAAANITVSFAQSAYSYTGSTISSNVIVNAYDVTGARVALNVTLTRDTTNFDFSGSPSTAVTTSTSADTLVPISVFGTGLLSVLAVPT